MLNFTIHTFSLPPSLLNTRRLSAPLVQTRSAHNCEWSEIHPRYGSKGTGKSSRPCPSLDRTSHWTALLSVQPASCAAVFYWTVKPSITVSTNKLDCLPRLLLSTHFYFLIYLFFIVPSWPRVSEQGGNSGRFNRPIRLRKAIAFFSYCCWFFLVIIQRLEICSSWHRIKQ